MHGFALFQGVQLHGPRADDLKNDGNGAGFAVKSGDGQGDALGIFLGADNDKLPGLGLFGNQRRVDPQLGHSGVQFPPFDDSKQSSHSFYKSAALHEAALALVYVAGFAVAAPDVFKKVVILGDGARSAPAGAAGAVLEPQLLNQRGFGLSLIHISEPTRQVLVSRMPSSA